MWAVVLLLEVGGLVGLGAGVQEIKVQRRLKREGVRTGGLVIHHHKQSDARHGPSYFAVVEFADAQGGRHTFKARSSGVKGLPVGGQVPVRYLPEVPADARIDIASKLIGDVTILFAFGVVFVGMGIWALVGSG